MNRNSTNRFGQIPVNMDIRRSRFDRSSQHKTTFDTGNLIPIYVDEIIPGDTVTMDMASIVRMSTPMFPVMDNAFMDLYFFFVPNRLVWEHWKEFNGENTDGHWTQETIYEIPQIKAPVNQQNIGWTENDSMSYMGIPLGVTNISVSHLPLRAYCLIWNEWFRDQNLQDPCYINKGDAVTHGANINDTKPYNYIIHTQMGAGLLKVNKYHDYFTSALPEPQKGPSILLPLGGNAPVITGDRYSVDGNKSLSWDSILGGSLDGAGYTNLSYMNEINPPYNSTYIDGPGGVMPVTAEPVAPSNLYADLSLATAATINELRQAFQIQKLFERDARGGTRYTEIIKSHFGVTSPDARQQRPEYLGGHRIPVNMDQVLQTSASVMGQSPQGNTAAYSLTGNQKSMFTKSFTEHGILMGLCCVRTNHTYQQGIERMWSRKKRFEFYWPTLANIGEQAILNKELFASGSFVDEEAFGYQEAWAEYRYKPSRTSAYMSSLSPNSLHYWHYADYYDAHPYLSNQWIQEPKNNVDRTLAVSSKLSHQFIADFAFRAIFTRPMPVYSVPGLIDHH